MSFLETLDSARAHLQKQGRLSLRALRREFELDDEALEELVEELVDVQRVATREGNVLSWTGATTAPGSERPPATPEPARDPRTYTPKHLADKILQSKSALEGERKQVTVLFADVKGSMDLAESVDAEDLHRIMDRFFEILADGVHRFEGTINQYTGDGIMALFGAPIAHEDHAQRACLAALALRDGLRAFANELRRERGLSFATRMGLHSGDVVVGKIGDDLRMDYTAQGQTVGLAARMEQIAEPGEIYLTETTARLVRGYMELEGLGPANVKGASEPVGIFSLSGLGTVRTRLEVSRARGLTRFVGRAEESAALDAALEHAAHGNGSVIGVVAEAGTGKSRLCFEFIERARARDVPVNDGYGVAHGKNVPLLPMLQLIRGAFGITDQDSDQQAREKVAGRLLLRDESVADLLPFLFDLMQVPDPKRPAPDLTPGARERLLADMVRRLLHGRPGDEPAILLLEDLHWFDAESDALLAHLVAGIPGARVVLLVNFRPGYKADWMQRSYYQQLPLQPLGPDDIRELVESLLGTDPSLGDLAARLQERSGGNPFFIEELVQALVEGGDLEGQTGSYRLVREPDALRMPPTVQAVLAARIDRLPEREKRALQAASVIGRTFRASLLAAIAELPGAELDDSLRKLVASEFLYEEALYPEAEYAFKHALTQEVAYGSQLADTRARLHAAVARAIEAVQPEKRDENAGLLAHHWDEAGEALEASRWHARAGARGVYTDYAGTTARHWQRVRDLLGAEPTGKEALALALRARAALIAIAGRRGVSDEEFAELLSEARTLARAGGDEESLARLLVSSAYGAMLRSDPRRKPLAQEARRISAHVADAGIRAAAAVTAGVLEWTLGSIAAARDRFEEAERIAADDPSAGADVMAGVKPFGLATAMRGATMAYCGDPVAGLEHSLRVARRAQRERDLPTLIPAAVACTSAAEVLGTHPELLPLAQAVFDMAEATGVAAARVQGRTSLAQAWLLAGEPDRAIEVLEPALEIVAEHHTMLPLMLHRLGAAHLARGELEVAENYFDRALAEASARNPERGYPDAQVLVSRARLLAERDGATAAERITSDMREARALVERAEAVGVLPSIAETEALAAGLRGDDAERRAKLAEARTGYAEMGATVHSERIDRELST